MTEALAEAGEILRAGGVVAFPTETFYGLGADARQEAAVEKIFRFKGRAVQNPISVIVDTEREVIPLVETLPAAAQILMQKFWPGATDPGLCRRPRRFTPSHGRHREDRHPRLQPSGCPPHRKAARRSAYGDERQSLGRTGMLYRRGGAPRLWRSP